MIAITVYDALDQHDPSEDKIRYLCPDQMCWPKARGVMIPSRTSSRLDNIGFDVVKTLTKIGSLLKARAHNHY